MRLAIPNQEIREIYVSQIMEFFKENVREDGDTLNRFCDALQNENVEGVEQIFNDYLRKTISIRDTAVRTGMKENFYHGMVLGLLQSRSDWLIQSNAELGEGYSDISICIPDKIGVVIELKYAEDGNLEKGCNDALMQIEVRKYAAGLQHKGMKKIIKYGIAFCEKECMVLKG